MRTRLLVGSALVLGMLVAPGVAGASGGCPNEQLRVEDNSTRLPDCRAYEMVTPAYKEGPTGPFTANRIASDGSSVFLTGFVDLAGALGEGVSTVAPQNGGYRDVRTSSGWSVVSSLNLSSSEYVGVMWAMELESGVSLWEAHTQAQSYTTRELYVRSASGGVVRIGPVSLPAESAGPPSNSLGSNSPGLRPIAATSNYGHVILRRALGGGPEDRWPS